MTICSQRSYSVAPGYQPGREVSYTVFRMCDDTSITCAWQTPGLKSFSQRRTELPILPIESRSGPYQAADDVVNILI